MSEEGEQTLVPAETPTDMAGAPAQEIPVSEMTNEQIYRMLQEQEFQKQKAKYEKYLRKALAEQMTGQEEEHKFWDTQPVPRLNDVVSEHGPIDANVDVATVKQEPYNMPAGFSWCTMDVKDPAQLAEMYKLLNENYVEDDDCHFRFDYSMPFLEWALTPPGYLQEWHVGVRNTKTGALMGCITAVPADIRAYETVIPMVEINFLCVHKKLRTKRLAPVLIKEVTRRVNLRGRWQAAYTAGVVIPKPVGRCRYYHRSLNPKKLIEIRFSSLPARTTLNKHLKDLKVSDKPLHPFRPMRAEDMLTVHSLLSDTLAKRQLAQVFSVEELSHVLLPRPGVVSSFVLENEDGTVTDICSYYHLPSTVIGNPKHDKLNAVYAYYNVANTISYLDLMKDCLSLAKSEGTDVFNALDLAENGPVFEPLKFGQGDGFLQYYLYNWKCPEMKAGEVGLVLL